jgi:hypothetical protein
MSISSLLGGYVPVLAIPAVCMLLLLAIAFRCLRLYQRRLAFLDTPAYQIQELAKKTMDFGVAYAELKFGRLLGAGSQGEVFLAHWRGLEVAVKKVDARKVPAATVEEFWSARGGGGREERDS